jgi:hypothetical protein
MDTIREDVGVDDSNSNLIEETEYEIEAKEYFGKNI